MIDIKKELADWSAAYGQAITIKQRLAQSDDPQVKWVVRSNERTTIEIAACKARVDCLLTARKLSNAAPAEATPAEATTAVTAGVATGDKRLDAVSNKSGKVQ
jgi:hypothetical protein